MLKIRAAISQLKTKFASAFKEAPVLPTAVFFMSVILMNIMASLIFAPEYLFGFIPYDGGVFVSFIILIAVDIYCKKKGAQYANILSFTAALVSFAFSGIISLASYLLMGAAGPLNGLWLTTLASCIALVVATAVNGLFNQFLGKVFKNKDNIGTFAWRALPSTAISQFVDNLLFIILAQYAFNAFGDFQIVNGFGDACIYAAAGVLLEFIIELVFIPVGYWIYRRWVKRDEQKKIDTDPGEEV